MVRRIRERTEERGKLAGYNYFHIESDETNRKRIDQLPYIQNKWVSIRKTHHLRILKNYIIKKQNSIEENLGNNAIRN